MNFVKVFLKPNTGKILIFVLLMIPLIWDFVVVNLIGSKLDFWGGFLHGLPPLLTFWIWVPYAVILQATISLNLPGGIISFFATNTIAWYLVSCLLYFTVAKVRKLIFSR